MDISLELKKVEEVCAGMLRAFYGGEPDLMEHVLHDSLARRGVLTDPNSGKVALRHAGKSQMVEAARSGLGKIPADEWNIETTVLDISETMATVRVESAYLLDICQLAKIGGRWKIVHVLWTAWRTPPWFQYDD